MCAHIGVGRVDWIAMLSRFCGGLIAWNRALPVRSRISSISLLLCRSSSSQSALVLPRADELDLFPLRERRESLLLERVPAEFDSSEKLGHEIGFSADRILLMKSAIGEFTGRAVVLCGPNESPVKSIGEMTARALDRADTQLFVEQCKRFFEFSQDIRRLAAEAVTGDGFNRIVTLTGLPKSYSRKDVMDTVSEATKGVVVVASPANVVFRFKRNGAQSDTCFVLLESETDALSVIQAVQEYAVPKRRIYGTSFGCAFVYADRSSLFVTDPSLDYALGGSKYWVMSLGWAPELDEQQMEGVLNKLALYPNKIVKGPVGGEFFLRFDRMKNTKLVFTRLNRLKKRWRIGAHVPFFAYPVRADFHFQGDKNSDEESDADSELDEPVIFFGSCFGSLAGSCCGSLLAGSSGDVSTPWVAHGLDTIATMAPFMLYSIGEMSLPEYLHATRALETFTVVYLLLTSATFTFCGYVGSDTALKMYMGRFLLPLGLSVLLSGCIVVLSGTAEFAFWESEYVVYGLICLTAFVTSALTSDLGIKLTVYVRKALIRAPTGRSTLMAQICILVLVLATLGISIHALRDSLNAPLYLLMFLLLVVSVVDWSTRVAIMRASAVDRNSSERGSIISVAVSIVVMELMVDREYLLPWIIGALSVSNNFGGYSSTEIAGSPMDAYKLLPSDMAPKTDVVLSSTYFCNSLLALCQITCVLHVGVRDNDVLFMYLYLLVAVWIQVAPVFLPNRVFNS